MFAIETALADKGYQLVAGVDEAGRGPLAGPVVAAAVIFPVDVSVAGIKDSKKLSSTAREKLAPIIFEKALSVGIGIISETLIDQINILQATRKAMQRAVQSLDFCPDYLIIDGVTKIDHPCAQETIVKGDAKSLSIAAASIVAKVTRDHMMGDADKRFPQYNFKKHKGYGTKEHLMHIREHGPCSLHRKTFKGVKEWV